jgi:hypothetical protein
MTHLKRRMVLSLAIGAFLALALGSVALATHPRPGGGSPFRVPLVPAFNKCGGVATADDPAPSAPNSTHVAPLAQPSCTPPVMKSSILTMGTAGAGQGSARLDVYCTNGVGPTYPSNGDVPPCSANAGDQEDIKVAGSASDVRCTVAVGLVCSAPGADYTGSLIAQSVIRITDHSNGSPATVCAAGGGAPPCVTATVSDLTFSVPVPCTDNGGANGANCSVLTTIDTLVPSTVKEFQRGVVAIQNIRAVDAGPDGSITPPPPFPCPPVCGSGDETKFAEQGIFIP